MGRERMECYKKRLKIIEGDHKFQKMPAQDGALVVIAFALSMLLDALDDINLTLEKIANLKDKNHE